MLSGWSTSGKFACPICMDSTESFRLKYGRKQCWWDRHRRFLHPNDRFRFDKKNFRANTTITLEPPNIMSSEQVYEIVQDYPKMHEIGRDPKIPGKGQIHNWCKQSIF